MGTIQDTRAEIATALEGLGAQTYAYIPGAAQLPGIVVGLPDRVNPTLTTGFWQLELPVFIVSRSASPLDGETTLLELMAATVQRLKETRSGTAFSTLRVVDVSELFEITVGTIEAHSCSVNLSVMLPSPV